MELELDKIRIDGGTQPRVEIDQGLVDEYAEAYERGDPMPPIVVFCDGSHVWLGDGFHRYHALRKVKRKKTQVERRQGTLRDAILYSVGVNSSHGQRRSNADKRKAVLTLLQDEEWGRWSNSAIAKRCEVSHTFVNGLRTSLETVSSDTASTGSRTRKCRTKHGSTATMKTSAIGRGSKTKDAAAGTDATGGGAGVDARATPPPPATPATESESVWLAFELRHRLEDINSQVEQLDLDTDSLFEQPLFTFINEQEVREAMATLKRNLDLEKCVPDRICPDCGDAGEIKGKRCDRCRGSGWLPKVEPDPPPPAAPPPKAKSRGAKRIPSGMHVWGKMNKWVPSYLLDTKGRRWISVLDREAGEWGYGASDQDRTSWAETFPACDIDIEMGRAIEWCLSNPDKGRKSNYRKFLTTWLSRSQDRGGTAHDGSARQTNRGRRNEPQEPDGDCNDGSDIPVC